MDSIRVLAPPAVNLNTTTLPMICRSLLRSKCICISTKGLHQRVYSLYTNKGFIFFLLSLSRANIIIYLFQSQLNTIAPCQVSGQFLNRSFFKIESLLVESNYQSAVFSKAALTSCPINASYHLGSSKAYSHQVLFTLSYPLLSLSPVFGCNSYESTKVSSLKYRFRSELAFLLCWRTEHISNARCFTTYGVIRIPAAHLQLLEVLIHRYVYFRTNLCMMSFHSQTLKMPTISHDPQLVIIYAPID